MKNDITTIETKQDNTASENWNKSTLNDELIDLIKKGIKEKKTYKDIAKELKIKQTTLYHWVKINKGNISRYKQQIQYKNRLREAEKVMDFHLTKKSLKASQFILTREPESRYSDKSRESGNKYSFTQINIGENDNRNDTGTIGDISTKEKETITKNSLEQDTQPQVIDHKPKEIKE